MGEATKIQWTQHTWNPWRGCTKVATGCKNCYMFREQKRYGKDPSVVVRTSKSTWAQVRKWNREAEKADRTDLVFVCSWSDFWHEAADEWRPEALEIMDQCENLIFQIPTKRPERIRPNWTQISHDSAGLGALLANHFRAVDARIAAGGMFNDPCSEHVAYVNERQRIAHRPNVWLGCSASTQEDLAAAVPHLLACRELSPVLFLSLEPLVGPIDLETIAERHGRVVGCCDSPSCEWCAGTGLAKSFDIDWVIVGGESGPNARQCNIAWIRSIVQQCNAARVPCFVKQLGSRPVCSNRTMLEDDSINGMIDMVGDNAPIFISDTKGGDPAEWPEDCCVREFPTVAVA